MTRNDINECREKLLQEAFNMAMDKYNADSTRIEAMKAFALLDNHQYNHNTSLMM